MTSSQGAFVTSVNEIPANCWYTDNKGKTVTAEVRGVFLLQNMLRFPRALDRLKVMWSVTAVLNSGSAVHFTPRDFLGCLTCLLTFLLTYLLTFLLTYLLTYLLTPWSRVLLEKLTGSAASQIPRIFGTRRFLTVLTSARHLSLSWANSIQPP